MYARAFFFLLATAVVVGCSRQQNFDEKVLNLVTPQKVKGYDPIYSSDMYSNNEVGKVYEGLLEFHYLKRPYELVPNLAESMPTVSADGLTYTFKLKKGVLFQDDECFPGGKGRELKSDDVLYSLRRLADPKLQSTGWWLVDGKIAGLNQWREKHAQTGKPDYAEAIEGLKKVDDYTLQFKLVKPFPQFLYALAMPFTFIVPREAVEKYGAEFQNQPVGTGPFTLDYFDDSNKITYHRNKTFREKLYPSEGEVTDEAAGLLADAGKRLPLVDKIVVHVQVESQPQWLEFQKGNTDMINPRDNFEQAVKGTELLPAFADKGVKLSMNPMLDVTYIGFNNSDPLFKDNLKLRRALSLAYDRNESNKLFYQNTAVPAQSPVPPGVAGYKKDFQNPWVKRDVELAKKLLAEAGYPGGKGLPVLKYETVSSTIARQMGEFFVKQMADIGVKAQIVTNTWPELINKSNKKNAQLIAMAWGADYPDAENFLGLLYGPNEAPGSNHSNFKNPEYDRLFAQASVMQDSPERTALYEKLMEMAAEQVPWIYGVHRASIFLIHGWVKNYKYIEFDHLRSQYLNVDLEVKKELSKKL